MIKINWDKIDKRYNYVAMDQDGDWYAYAPKKVSSVNAWLLSYNSNYCLMLSEEQVIYYGATVNWEDSLQSRPFEVVKDFSEENFIKFIYSFEENVLINWLANKILEL